MKVGIDGRGAILYRGTGIGTYSWQLIHYLLKSSLDLSVYLPGDEYQGLDFSAMEIPHDYWLDVVLPKKIVSEDIDIYHVPQNGIGFPKEKKSLQVSTIHDMIPYVMPSTVGRGYLREFIGEMPDIISNSDGIIAVSEQSKKDILDFFDYDADNIYVIHEAAEPQYKPMDKNVAKDYLACNYGIDCDYVLYVGGYGFRKNVKALVIAFAKVVADFNEPLKLVLPGNRQKDFDQLDVLVEALGIKDRIVFPGYVPVADLPYFYGGAKLFCYPSYYEGFGLPPLEAMSMGIPVLSSNSSSMPEVLGDSAYYFNPYNVKDLTDKLGTILSDNNLREHFGAIGLKQAKKYSWEKTAAETIMVYKDIYKKSFLG